MVQTGGVWRPVTTRASVAYRFQSVTVSARAGAETPSARSAPAPRLRPARRTRCDNISFSLIGVPGERLGTRRSLDGAAHRRGDAAALGQPPPPREVHTGQDNYAPRAGPRQRSDRRLRAHVLRAWAILGQRREGMVAHPPAQSIRIELLGGFRVIVGARAVPADAWTGRRSRELVQLLALSDRHEVLREQALDDLWPQLAPQAAANNLRKAAHYARQALGIPDAVVLRGGSVRLLPSHRLQTDVGEFERAATSAL